MDPVLLHIYYQQNPQVEIIPKRVKLSVAQILRKASLLTFAFGFLIFLILYAPSLIFMVLGASKPSYLLFSKAKDTLSTTISYQAKADDYQPRLDTSLPLENRVSIPSVGINTKINEMSYENYEEALKVGVWRVPDFGTPYERKVPVILAAHRYGYLRWSVPYRLKNSFYNLPKVKVGDTVEIIWRQRKYIYEVYAEGKGEEITDYSADLILYTCEDLTSPIRIFKYARLIRV